MSRYPHSYISLIKELDQQKERAEGLDANLIRYQQVFAWLLKQEWYKNKVHTIPKNLLK